MSIYRFAESYGNPLTGVRFRRAKVTATPSSNKVSLSMDSTTGATTHTNVNYFGSNPPKNGDTVWVVVIGAEVFCLGSAVSEGGALPAVEVSRSALQSISTGTATDVIFDTLVSADPWGMWDAVGGVSVTAPISGFYTATASVSWNNIATGTYRAVRLLVAGSQKYVNQIVHPTDTIGTSQNTVINVAGVFRATAGQIIKIQVIHDRGSSLDILAQNGAPRLAVAYLGAVP